MKTKIISYVMGCTLFLLITSSSFSQADKNLYNASAIEVNLKSSFANPDAPAEVPIAARDKISKSFSKYFGNATDQYWSMAGKNFLNSFHTKGLLIHALFNKNGHLIYTISYGSEKDMPADVRKIVKSTYYDYAITLAVEVKENNRDIWVVHLNDDREFLTVRIEDGEMEQVEQFEKAKNNSK